MDYVRDEHRVHVVACQLVWYSRRRRRVLVGQAAEDCERIIGEVCAERGWEAIRLTVAPDHVHLFARANLATAAREVARAVKGGTGRLLREQYPVLLRLPSLWTRSYFCSTVGSVSDSTVQRYVAAQIGR
jgi:putative transposase